MTKMYFAENPDAKHDIHELNVELLGQRLTFLTDAGVFSKKMIDYGSRVLLSVLDFEAGERVLDVGCGYGPLGLTLAKAYGVAATMVDINQRALDLAQKNAERNQVSAHIFMKRSVAFLTILSVIRLSVLVSRLYMRLSAEAMSI